MLNYDAAAQTYFGYKTDSLTNAFLTDDGNALVAEYVESMVADIVKADTGNSAFSFLSEMPPVC